MDVSTIVKRNLPDPNQEQLQMLAGVVNTAIEHTDDPSRKAKLVERRDALMRSAAVARIPMTGERSALAQIVDECAHVNVNDAGLRKAIGADADKIREVMATVGDYAEAKRFIAAVNHADHTGPEPFNQIPANVDLRHPSMRSDEQVRATLAIKESDRKAELKRWAEIRREHGIRDPAL